MQSFFKWPTVKMNFSAIIAISISAAPNADSAFTRVVVGVAEQSL